MNDTLAEAITAVEQLRELQGWATAHDRILGHIALSAPAVLRDAAKAELAAIHYCNDAQLTLL